KDDANFRQPVYVEFDRDPTRVEPWPFSTAGEFVSFVNQNEDTDHTIILTPGDHKVLGVVNFVKTNATDNGSGAICKLLLDEDGNITDGSSIEATFSIF